MEEKHLPDSMVALADMCCGCGDPRLFYQAAYNVLCYFETPHAERIKDWIYNDGFKYFVVNVLTTSDFLEHGTSLGGSWLSDAGKEVLAFLREHGTDWDEKADWVSSENVHYGVM